MYQLVRKKKMNKGIPSPFWGGVPPLPTEVAKEVDEIARALTPHLDRLARFINEKQVGCFEIGGQSPYGGVEIYLHVHNPERCGE
jgi:hypothetical protein